MGPIWGRQDSGGPHVGPMNFAIWVVYNSFYDIKVRVHSLIHVPSLPFHACVICSIGLYLVNIILYIYIYIYARADSRFAPSQWETALLCNDVSHWLGVGLESAMYAEYIPHFLIYFTLSLIARKGPWYCFLVNLKIHAVYILPNYK